MHLTSSAFSAGAPIPVRYTCDGKNHSPPLAWEAVPPGTQSFVLLCDDPDAPAGTWHHWAVYDLPADHSALAENASHLGDPSAFKQAVNDFRKTGYGGPCPPPGHGVHHYHFRLLALAVTNLPVPQGASCREVEREARKHVIAETTLIGLYQR